MNSLTIILNIAACLLTLTAFYIYYFDIKKAAIKSNRLTWIIWSVSLTLDTLTYVLLSGDIFKSLYFIFSAAACLFITYTIWKKSGFKKPTKTEIASFLFCTVAIVFWMSYSKLLLAQIMLVISIPVGFLPTIRDVINDASSENSKAWFYWVICDLMVLLIVIVHLKNLSEFLYIVTELLCHLIVFVLVVAGKRKAFIHKFKFTEMQL